MDSEILRIAVALERIVELLEGKQGLLATSAKSADAVKADAPKADKKATKPAPEAPKTEEKPTETPKAEAPAAKAPEAPKAETPTTKEVKIEDIRARVNDLLKLGKQAIFQKAMKARSVAKLSDLPTTEYAALLAELNQEA